MSDTKRIKEFYDLDVWQKAHKLVIGLYALTKNFPKDERFGLVSQTRRAAVSISANIAEGFSRYHYNDKINFYYHSRGPVSETQNLLLIARDLKYLSRNKADISVRDLNEINKMINGLIRSIESQK